MEKIDPRLLRARIVEVGMTSGELACELIEAGGRYLGIVEKDEVRHEILRRFPGLADRIIVSSSGRILRQNNAEVLIPHGHHALRVLERRSYRHVRYLLLPADSLPRATFSLLLGKLGRLAGGVGRPRKICMPSGRPLLLYEVRHRAAPGARRYIPHSLGVSGFFAALAERGVRYSVLRWFDELPSIEPGEDLDLLVDDDDLDTISELLESEPGTQALDLYTVTGLPGTDFRSMPYYPPYLAQEILDRAVLHRGVFRVPALREHFLSLAYHVLYHKGYGSALPPGAGGARPGEKSDHDYPAVLSRLASALGHAVPVGLAEYDEFLDSQGWRPPHDMLIRLARHNRWIKTRLVTTEGESTADYVAVFILRTEALARGGIARTRALLEREGFIILAARQPSADVCDLLARSIRGGNWGAGPWPVSGGRPAAIVIAADPAPIAPTRAVRKRYPFLKNERILCKERIRDAFNEGKPSAEQCNVIHSSDNGREALDYLRIVARDPHDPLHRLIQAIETAAPIDTLRAVAADTAVPAARAA